MSLFRRLGYDYSNDWFRGALVLSDGNPGVVDGVSDDGTVRIIEWDKDGHQKLKVVGENVFSSFSSFSYPSLGYRQCLENHLLVYAIRTPSVRRGLHLRDVMLDPHWSTRLISDYIDPSQGYRILNADHFRKAKLILLPQYTSFKEGLPKLIAGAIPHFAMSAQFAVAPSMRKQEHFDILYRGRAIGIISPNGNVSMNVTNNMINSLWNKEISRG